MKRLLTFLVFVGLFSFQMNAQWSSTRVGVTLGGDVEMPHGLDHNYLLSTATNNDFDANMIPFGEGELVRMDCDNGTSRISLAYAPSGKKKYRISVFRY